MDVKVEDSGPCRRVMHVNADAEQVKPAYDKVVKEFAKAVKLPGFRKGRAPAKVVESRFTSEIDNETKDRLVPQLYADALKQIDLKPVAVVSVSDVSFAKEKGINFDVVVDVVPEFKLPKYKKVTVKGKRVEVEESRVEETITRLRDAGAQFEDVEGRAVQAEDLVMLDYQGEVEGTKLADLGDEAAALGEASDFWALVGEPEFLPGSAAALVGAEVGKAFEMPVHFPDDFRVTSLSGKDAVFNVTVKGVREKKLPEMDEAFLKRFEVDSESALREKVLTELTAGAEQEEVERLKNEIAKYLLSKTKFDVPQSIVEQETSAAARNMVQQMAMGGATKEQIEQQRDDIVSAATESSTERVKISYILDRIASEENVAVTDDELEARIEQMAGRYRMTAGQFKAELEKRDGLDGVRSSIRNDKTLDLLYEHAKIK